MNDKRDNDGRGNFRRRRRGGRGGRGDNGQQSGPADLDEREDTPENTDDTAPETSDNTPSSDERVVPTMPSLKVPADKTVVIGVTGEPGAGKSALARELVKLGATLVDADSEGHELIEVPAIKKKLVKEFGDDILNDDGEIDRRKLGSKAFASAETTKALNEIVHPKLSLLLKAAVKKGGNFVVIDCALLHELGLGELCNQAIYVRAPREARQNRVAERGWDEAELVRRETALGEPDARRRSCQLTVDNSGDAALLTAYAKTILARQLGVDLAALRKAAPVAPAASNDDDDDKPRAEASALAPAMRNAENGQRNPEQRDQRPFQPHGNQPPQRLSFNSQGQPIAPGQNPQNQQAFEARPPVKIDLDAQLRKKLPDLQGEAEKLGVQDVKWLKKHDLINEILKRTAGGRQDEILIDGFVEMFKDQHAFVRSPINGYLPVSTDTFISIQQLRRYGLKAGMHVTGAARAPRGQERGPQLISIQTIMGEPEGQRTPVQDFEHLVPLHAHGRLFMELPGDPTDYSLRIIDLVAPIGKGQRGLIVAQPKCGKTVYLQKIAKAITTNNPEVSLIVLLVDERPEEVTDMQRSVKGEVVASTFDQPASRHVQCAETVINKAKRLVERGKDVVILLDSITRLARAYNTEAPSSGRIMSGGIEAGALIKPKQFFGAARKIEDGGSLTILATALVDTGSLMDTVIFEEFKGTGNMELVLDRRLANRRVFPAVDCAASGTRKDELLIKNEDELRRVWALRKFLAERNGADAIEFLKSKLKNYKTNVEFLLSVDPDKLSTW